MNDQDCDGFDPLDDDGDGWILERIAMTMMRVPL